MDSQNLKMLNMVIFSFYCLQLPRWGETTLSSNGPFKESNTLNKFKTWSNSIRIAGYSGYFCNVLSFLVSFMRGEDQ